MSELFPLGQIVATPGALAALERFVGHDAVLGWSDREFIGAHGQMTGKKVEQIKNVVTVEADWKSSYYSGPSRFEFVLDGEQMQALTSRQIAITSGLRRGSDSGKRIVPLLTLYDASWCLNAATGCSPAAEARFFHRC
jgi:hypothetical protein